MNKILQIPLIIALFLINFNAFSSMEFWVDYKIFSIPDEQAYVETYINFTGTSLTYSPIDSTHVQSNVEILYYFKQGEKIITYKKILLDGPSIIKGYSYIDFLDVQRFMLDDGKYEIVIEVKDLNNPSDQKKYNENFEIKRSTDKPYISNISFLKGYSKADTPTDLTKSGYNLLPFVSNYFPSEFNSLIFYAEVYSTDSYFGEKEKYALYYSIKDTKTKTVAGGNQVIKRQDVASVTPILHTFDISQLPKGDYELSIEVRNKNNEIITRQTQPFFRQKFEKKDSLPPEPEDRFVANQIDITETFAYKYNNREELLEHLYSLAPKATSVELATIRKVMPEADLTTMQQYLFYFWSRRYSNTYATEWEKYRKEVILVNELYGTYVKKGYDSDRGRIHLKYGPPSSKAERHYNPSMAPYEVWHYYEIGDRHDKRFLFYDPTRIGRDFTLLTSDMPSEVQEPNWYKIMTTPIYPSDPQHDVSTKHGQKDSPSHTTSAEGEVLKDLYFHTR